MTEAHRRTSAALALVAVLVWVVALVRVVSACRPRLPPPRAPAAEYGPELAGLLAGKLAALEELARDPAIREAVEAANRANAVLTDEEIAARDARWRRAADDDDPEVAAVLAGAASQRLMAFRAAHPGFSEIFVTDRRGLVAAMTNRTSDYLQADEDWWLQAYAGGKGCATMGAIEYDESSRSQDIPLCVPIRATPGEPAAGVIKAVYGVDAIKAEL